MVSKQRQKALKIRKKYAPRIRKAKNNMDKWTREWRKLMKERNDKEMACYN